MDIANIILANIYEILGKDLASKLIIAAYNYDEVKEYDRNEAWLAMEEYWYDFEGDVDELAYRLERKILGS